MENDKAIREKILEGDLDGGVSSKDDSPALEPESVGEEEEEPKEITVRVVVLSVILAIVLGSANVYLGLFAGENFATVMK